jgi:hypothetical protein
VTTRLPVRVAKLAVFKLLARGVFIVLEEEGACIIKVVSVFFISKSKLPGKWLLSVVYRLSHVDDGFHVLHCHRALEQQM